MANGDQSVTLYGRTHIIDLRAGTVDLVEREEHELGIDTTTYPIESGEEVIDHITQAPDKLKLTFVTSATSFTLPVQRTGDAATEDSDATLTYGEIIDKQDRPYLAWQEIRAQMRRGTLFSVVSHLGRYENMVIARAEATVDEKTGTNLMGNVELIEIILPGRGAGDDEREEDDGGEEPTSNAEDREPNLNRGEQETTQLTEEADQLNLLFGSGRTASPTQEFSGLHAR